MQYAISLHVTSNVDFFMKQNGDTALMWAAWSGHEAMVTPLLDRGASINLSDKVETLSVSIVFLRICSRDKVY